MREHPVDVGHRSEIAVLHHLTQRGYVVYQPVSVNCRSDFLVDTGSRFVRVQCKTARARGAYVEFTALSIRSNRTQILGRTYEGEIDVFAAYCEARDEVFLVPIDEATRSNVRLRLAPTANNQASRVRWAEDYLLDVIAPSLLGEAPRLRPVAPE